jgi:hypothetical protein
VDKASHSARIQVERSRKRPGVTIKCAATIFLAWSCFLVTCELTGCADSSEIDKQSDIHTPQSEAVKPPDSSSASGPIAVRVCSASATGTPCSPHAELFADPQFTLSKLSTGLDADGTYYFYAKPGMYLLEISGDGFTAQHFSVAVPPLVQGAATSEAQVTVHTNGTGLVVTFSGGLLLPDLSSQTAPSPGVQSAPTSTTVSLVSGIDGSPQSQASGQLFVGRVYPVAPTPVLGAGQPIQWVAYDGNDANDGSLGSPKATVMAAYDALPPTGGTINISQGLSGDATGIPLSSMPGVNIWIAGPGDPNYNSLPPGWHAFKPNVSFIGIAGTSHQADSHSAGQVELLTFPSQPCIRLSGFGGPMFFQNLLCDQGSRGIVIGETSNGLRDGTGYVANVTFQNVAGSPVQSATTGPGVDITGNSFWLYFYDCVFFGNWDAPVMDNKRAAMLIDGTGNGGNRLIFVNNLNTSGGGIKFIPGQNGGGLVVNGMTEEGSFSGTPVPPAIYVTYTNNYTSFNFQNVQVSDGSATGTDAVLIGGNGPSEAVLVDGYTSGSNGPAGTGVVGPATVMGQYPNAVANTAQSPASMGQVGFFDGYVVGQTDVARRNFGPVAIRFPNIAAQIPSSWVLDHDVTVVSGIPAPDGTNGAGQANVAVPVQESVNFFANNQTSIAVGDYFIGGAWLRSLSATGGYSGGSATTAIFLNLNQGNAVSGETQGAISSGENEWTWQWLIYKLTTVGTPIPYITFGSYCDLTHPIQAYAPVLMHIPAGTISDNEAYQIATNLSAYPDGLPAGTVATLRGQTFAFGGTGNYFGSLTQSNTANRTYQFPDASGTVPLLNIPQTWTAPQTLPSAVLTDPIIDGQQLDSPVIATYTAILPGTLTNPYTASTFTLDYGIVVSRVEITLKTAPQGCASSAVVSLNGSTDLDVPINAVMSDSGPVTIPMNVGTPLQVVLSAPAQGCSIPPQDANVVVHYRMQ